MKQFIFKKITLFFLIILTTSSICKAESDIKSESEYTATRKLGRGVANILTGVFEIPRAMGELNKSDGGWAAITVGLFTGIGRFFTREGVGLWELFTFPFSKRVISRKPYIYPEFQWEPVDSPYRTTF